SLAKTAEREAELMQRHREAEARSTQRALEAKADAERQAKAAALAADRAFAAKLKEREEEVERANQRVAQATAQEAELARRARQLDEREERSKLELERQLAEESERQRKVQNATFEERVRVMAEEKSREAAQQLAQGQAELRALRESLTKTIEREAELVRRQRELEEREAQRAADVERRITEERARERRVAEMRVGEQLAQQQAQAELREVEYKRTIEGLQKEMTQVQQRLTQGSQQAQGEAQEEALHALLSRTCPRDELDDVPIGKAGADLLQTVMETGRVCGKVLWESKRTKAWSDEWLPKLRDDQRASGAEWSVLVTQALPSDVKTFGLKDGVWVCSWLHVAPFVTLLRSAVVQVATARSVVEGHTDKVHLLYRYMTGPEFRGRLEGVLEAFTEMHEALAKEKRAMSALWKTRERQIERALENLSAMHGDIRGIGGRSVPAIASLDLAALPAGDAQEPDAGDGHDGGGKLTELFFELLPADGVAVGNKSHAEHLSNEAVVRFGAGVTDEEYERCKTQLVDEGRIR
ncbi:MAG: DUF2130 domain-containing protein, partial [Phycisphaerales bacterium]|nr:DUF2130 domain-containing protein [Phycisphaerales bacterium]